MSVTTITTISVCAFFEGIIIGAFIMFCAVFASKHFKNTEYSEKNDSFDEQDRNEY